MADCLNQLEHTHVLSHNAASFQQVLGDLQPCTIAQSENQGCYALSLSLRFLMAVSSLLQSPVLYSLPTCAPTTCPALSNSSSVYLPYAPTLAQFISSPLQSPLTKRDELWFMRVAALPKASSTGLTANVAP